jgi:dolichol kinase
MRTQELPSVDQSYGVEVMRKGIHLGSLAIPIVYFFIDKNTALLILVPLTAIVGLADFIRLIHVPSGRVYDRYLGFLLRSHERFDQGKKLNGATFVLLSATICVLVFPKVIVITAFAILIVSDSAAALVGRRFGRHPFLAKSLEGSTAFFISALFVVAAAPKIQHLPIEYLIGFAAALLGALVEASPIAIDDNLSIPVCIGAAMWLMYALFLPGVNVYSLG